MADPMETLQVAMSDVSDFYGSPAYRAFRDLLVAIEAVHVEKFRTAKPEQLLPLQNQYRQVVALREALESKDPAGELPLP